MAFDTIIRGGTVATASDTFACDVGISGGRIAALGADLGPATEIVDATGKLVLPGGIDSHVHFAQPSGPGIVMADDFASGTRSAAFGGNTMVLPFALQQKGESLREVVKAYHAKADGRCYVDVSFHLIIADASDAVLGQELPALVEDGYTSFKVFMTYEGLWPLRPRDAQRDGGGARDRRARHGACRELRRHPLPDRPAGARRQDRAALSCNVAADRGRARGHAPRDLARRAGRCAGHDRARVEPRRHGGNPPRAAARPQGLWRDLPAISRAHRGGPGRPQHGGREICLLPAPARQAEPAGVLGRACSSTCSRCSRPITARSVTTTRRESSFRRAARASAGCRTAFPGVETRLPILFSEGVGKGRISLNDFVALTATNHARTYGLYPGKGTIAVGSDADIAIWDPQRQVTISQSLLHHGSDYTPYEGIAVTGWPVSTMVRGKFVVRDGELVGKEGEGHYVSRAKSPLAQPAGREARRRMVTKAKRNSTRWVSQLLEVNKVSVSPRHRRSRFSSRRSMTLSS